MADARIAGTNKIVAAFVADVVLLILFVILGRRSHHEDGSFLVGTAKVVAPFLIALVVGWVVARGWNAPAAPATGIVIWLITVAGGMVLRHFAFSRSTAVSFIIVASVFTLAFLVGWRMLWEWRTTRH